MNRIALKIIVLSVIIGVGLSFGSCKRGKGKSKNGVDNPVVLQVDENQGNYNGMFSIPEIEITPSPDTACQYVFSKEEQVIDYSVSPTGAYVAVIVEKNEQCNLKFWTIGSSEILNGCALPKNFKAETVVWHPQASALFVLGTENAASSIYRIENANSDWTVKQIFSSKQKLKNMLVCPQPFVIDYKKGISIYAYRLFLGMDNGDNTYRIVSITEQGKRFYQMAGPAKTQTTKIDEEEVESPSEIKAAWAMPMAFHPAGNQLIWQDKNHNFFVASYSVWWDEAKPLKLPLKNKDALIPTPNGLGMISWKKNTSGIELYLISKKSNSKQLTEYQFETAPVSVPDGKGVVGKTIKQGVTTLHYAPVNVPLPNILNAWTFIHSAEELDLFQKHYGLFRPTDYEQLYGLYETENYSTSYPTRPYIVTTDIFWEIFGAAYQGIFIIKEREQAIPNFWQFINEADNYFKTNYKTSKWNAAFTVLKNLQANNTSNREVVRIIKEENDISEVTQENYAFSNLKPRGHYTSSEEMKLYFKAFRYFTTILADTQNQDVLKELEKLPSNISQYALNWINSYSEFIAPSRSSLVWKNLKTEIPKYCQYPNKWKAIFPLSWGFDNEVFYSTVYHEDFPENLRMEGLNGARLLPSGVDIATVLGSGFAEKLLADDYAQYPPLRKVIDNLRSNYKTHSNSADFKSNLYNQWMNAMAVQWADSVNSTSGKKGEAIWQTKRLQTGLATWATLRHATVLVNERVAAECGEGGFEEIIMKSPRGAVEADPYTFRSIADLFRELLKTASKLKSKETDKQALYNGLVKRLEGAIEETLSFASMAEKERKGEKLTNEEYEKIFYVARVAEHLLLVFRSLQDNEYSISIPEPMAKIADVSSVEWSKRAVQKGTFSYLMAAVGNPLEWNYIVPYYGRYQVVKGSIYSYYEFESKELLNDEEWRERVKKQAILSWIKPYMVSHSVSKDTGY